jgi:hypothetical protein
MVGFSKNDKWKYSTIGLLAVLAMGFSFPQAFAAPIDSVLSIVKDIQAKVNSNVFGLSAIKTAVDSKASQTSVDDMQSDVSDIQGLIESTRPKISFSETLDHPSSELTVFEDTFPMGGIVSVDVSGTQQDVRLAMTCDGGGVFLSDGHHEIPRFCKDNLKFGLSLDLGAEPSVQVTGDFIVTNVEPLDP